MATYNNVLLNGTAFYPTGYKRKPQPVGKKIEHPSSKTTWVQRVDAGGVAQEKFTWELEFKSCTQSVMQSLEALARSLSWTLRDLTGTTYTVRTEQDGCEISFVFRDEAGNHYWDVTLSIYSLG